jgi:hypothetical protein
MQRQPIRGWFRRLTHRGWFRQLTRGWFRRLILRGKVGDQP